MYNLISACLYTRLCRNTLMPLNKWSQDFFIVAKKLLVTSYYRLMSKHYLFPIIALLFYSCEESSFSKIVLVNKSLIDTIPFDYLKTDHIRVTG